MKIKKKILSIIMILIFIIINSSAMPLHSTPSKNNNLMIFKNSEGLYGVVLGNEIIIPSKYSNITLMNEFCLAKKDKFYDIYNSEGKLLDYGDIHITNFKRTRTKTELFVCSNNMWGVISVDGSLMVPCIYDYLEQPNSALSYYVYTLEGYTGVIDDKGNVIIPIDRQYDRVELGMYIKVWKNGKCGLCGYNNRELLSPNTYDDCRHLTDNLIVTKSNTGWGVVDFDGKNIVPNIYSKIKDCPGTGFPSIKVYEDDKCGIYLGDGSLVIPCIYDEIIGSLSLDRKFNSYSYFTVYSGKYQGICDEKGNILVPPSIFDKVEITHDKDNEYTGLFLYIRAFEGDRKCIFDPRGKLYYDSANEEKRESYLADASSAFRKENFGKALKLYKQADDLRSTYSTSYNIAACHQNMGHWDDALSYYEKCVSQDPPQTVLNNIYENLIALKESREAEYQKNQNILSIISCAFDIGRSIYFNRTQGGSHNNSASINPYNTSGSYTNDDVSNSSVETSTSVKSRKICNVCKGDGKCIGCHGSKIRTDNMFGTGQDPTHSCSVCGGTGTCNVCHGSGYK